MRTSLALSSSSYFSSTAYVMLVCSQQDDLTALGKLVLALACRSLIAVQRENVQTSLDLVARSYSTDLRNLIM
uniref:(California timema) hypothetical protein n=1 Tax=Timema californicum TaxID=61474 RepID=A0A7R9J0A2_TIMCA|nr:unnamed protein product [Timema californicum]